MSKQAGNTSELIVALLDRHREEIASSWVEMVRQIPNSNYQERSADELRGSVMKGSRRHHRDALRRLLQSHGQLSRRNLRASMATWVRCRRSYRGLTPAQGSCTAYFWKELILVTQNLRNYNNLRRLPALYAEPLRASIRRAIHQHISGSRS